MFVSCFEFNASVIVKYMEHVGIIRAGLPRGTY